MRSAVVWLSALGVLTLTHWALGFWASGAFVVWQAAVFIQVPQLVASFLAAMR